MKIRNYAEVSLDVTGDRVLEEMQGNVPAEVMSWLSSFKGVKDEAGYPATLKGEHGFLYTAEFWHTDMKDEIAATWVADNPDRTSVHILDYITLLVRKIQDVTNEVECFVGESTGPLECHELLVFIKSGSPSELYQLVLDIVMGKNILFST